MPGPVGRWKPYSHVTYFKISCSLIAKVVDFWLPGGDKKWGMILWKLSSAFRGNVYPKRATTASRFTASTVTLDKARWKIPSVSRVLALSDIARSFLRLRNINIGLQTNMSLPRKPLRPPFTSPHVRREPLKLLTLLYQFRWRLSFRCWQVCRWLVSMTRLSAQRVRLPVDTTLHYQLPDVSRRGNTYKMSAWRGKVE